MEEKDGTQKKKQPDSKSKKIPPSMKKSHGRGGHPRVEARVSVEELRAAYRKQMSLPGSDAINKDTHLNDPMEKCRAVLGTARGATGVVYDSIMAEPRCLWDSNYPECPERYTSVIERCTELGLLERCQRIPSRAATEAELLTQHSPELVTLVRETAGETDNHKLEEMSSNYDSIYIHPSSSDAAEVAAGSTISLVDAVLQGVVHNGMAIVRPPGHHALPDTPCGYCLYNSVAVAATHALQTVDRVLIVDWDVHHGQATQRMFYHDDRVMYLSVHRYEHGSFWPNLRESNYDYTGAGAGKGYTCNIPLNATGLGNLGYLSIWTQLVLPLAYQFRPELVLVSAGYDAALGCMEGEMSVSPAFYSQLTSLLMPLAGGKMVVVMEGGYCLESLSEGAALTLRTLLGDPCPPLLDQFPKTPPHPSLSSSVLDAISCLRGQWSCLQFQGSYHTDQRSSRGSACRHVPELLFTGPQERAVKFETRECYPQPSNEQTVALKLQLDRLKLGTPLSGSPAVVCYYYDTEMEAHHCTTESAHPERPARTRQTMKLLKDRGLLERMTKIPRRLASASEVERVHACSLVRLVAQMERLEEVELARLQDQYTSVYLHAATPVAARLAVGGVLQTVESVVSGVACRGVAVVRPPGHHAEHDEPNGFCIYNNVAIAAAHATDVLGLERVLIVDWDIHHGNGIQHAFESDPRVLYVSVHLYKGGSFFPHSPDADMDKVGVGKGEGYNINLPWEKGGVGDAEYIAAFTQLVLPVAYQFSPQLVIVAAGFDAAVNDPVGGCEVSPECYGHLTHFLKGLAGGRLVLALEGGYNLISTSHSLAMCCSSLLGDPLPPLALHPCAALHAVATITAVLDTQARYWPVLRPYRVDLPVVSTAKGSTRAPVSSVVEDQIIDKMASLKVDDDKSADTNAPGSSDCIAPETSSGAAAVASSSGGATGGGAVVLTEEQLLAAVGGGAGGESLTIGQLIEQQGGGGGFMVEPLSWCPHLQEGVRPLPADGLRITDPCYSCQSDAENWVCLTCYKVGCGRFVSGHMVDHGAEADHPLVLSYADLSVWCYKCEQYIHHKALARAKQSAHRSKFGEDLPGTSQS